MPRNADCREFARCSSGAQPRRFQPGRSRGHFESALRGHRRTATHRARKSPGWFSRWNPPALLSRPTNPPWGGRTPFRGKSPAVPQSPLQVGSRAAHGLPLRPAQPGQTSTHAGYTGTAPACVPGLCTRRTPETRTVAPFLAERITRGDRNQNCHRPTLINVFDPPAGA